MKTILPRIPIIFSLVLASQAYADGRAVFDNVCAKCHRTGVMGAPVAGDKTVWEPRLKAGLQNLYDSAQYGKNDMPPKGGKERLSAEDVKSAVDYLLSLAGLGEPGGRTKTLSENK